MIMDPKKLKRKAIEALTMGFEIAEIAQDLRVTEAEIVAVLPAKWKAQISAPKAVAPAEALTPYGGPVHAYLVGPPMQDRSVGLGGNEAPAMSDYGSRNWCEHCGSSAGCDCRAARGLTARPVRLYAPRGERGTGM